MLSLNINKLRSDVEEREKKKRKIFENILEMCYQKILNTNKKSDDYNCTFIVPNVVFGLTLYNIETVKIEKEPPPYPVVNKKHLECEKINLTKNHTIFEFGCGASTLFFASKVKKVISLESNRRWFEIITSTLKNSGDFLLEKNYFSNANCEILLMEDALDRDE